MIIVLPNHVNEYQSNIIIANTDLRVSKHPTGNNPTIVVFMSLNVAWEVPVDLLLPSGRAAIFGLGHQLSFQQRPIAGNLEGAGLGTDEISLICCGNAQRVFLKES